MILNNKIKKGIIERKKELESNIMISSPRNLICMILHLPYIGERIEIELTHYSSMIFIEPRMSQIEHSKYPLVRLLLRN